MSAHRTHKLDSNSLAAYYEGKEGEFDERITDILRILRAFPGLTDRQVMRKLDRRDPNHVRPRISELLGAGVLEKVGSVRDDETGKTVRTTRIRPDPRAPQLRATQVEFASLVDQVVVKTA